MQPLRAEKIETQIFGEVGIMALNRFASRRLAERSGGFCFRHR